MTVEAAAEFVPSRGIPTAQVGLTAFRAFAQRSSTVEAAAEMAAPLLVGSQHARRPQRATTSANGSLAMGARGITGAAAAKSAYT